LQLAFAWQQQPMSPLLPVPVAQNASEGLATSTLSLGQLELAKFAQLERQQVV
jgi:hypothetical protein